MYEGRIYVDYAECEVVFMSMSMRVYFLLMNACGYGRWVTRYGIVWHSHFTLLLKGGFHVKLITELVM